uniref:hypothetical protein n=1 Tax=Trichocoleus desertorum TaxID=1481672 RepID=UPI0025B3E690|nr:hypothetical protein [Trichocoleus desertorum]
MTRATRVKLCDRCANSAPVLYRVKLDESEQWDRCWPEVSQDNPFYVYGGTWKAQKRR